MNFSFLHPADQIVLFMNRIYQAGLTTTSGGNLSICDGNGNIWISPSGIDKGTLTRNDIMCVKPDGTVTGPHKPSMELPFHSSVYRGRQDLKAVLHAHPPALVAFSLARKLPNINLLSSIKSTCSGISIAPYAVPGSIELGKNVSKEFEKGYNSVILENHGACVSAETMYDAFIRFETLERCALIEINARKIGQPLSLNENQINLTRIDNSMKEFEPAGHTSEELAVRRDMIKFIHRCCTQHLFGSSHGTYSAILSDGSILITPEGKDRFWLEESDLVLIKEGCREKGKNASIFTALHSAIYKNHPEIKSLAGAQPYYTMAFAVTGTPIDSRTIPESYIQLRTIGNASFEDQYINLNKTADMMDATTQVILFKNGQILAAGTSLVNAFDRLEVAEATAHSLISAMDIGQTVPISDKEISIINKTFSLPE
jgi:L-fuculose-phosphate aldolase